jgi:RHS repeat-associated protein
MLMGERTFSGENYRWGFNGQEKDDEVSGAGNNLDYGARIYDGRLGRWMSVDPFTADYPVFSPYTFCKNQPTFFIDLDGNRFVNPYTDEKVRLATTLTAANDVYDKYVKNNPSLTKNPTLIRALFNSDYKEQRRLLNEKKSIESAYNEASQNEILINNMLYTLSIVNGNLYNRIEDLEQDIRVYLSENIEVSRDNPSVGETAVKLILYKNGQVGLGSPQDITLYHHQGLGTLANELGDIEYALDHVKNEEQFYKYNDKSTPYRERPETQYSFDIEGKTTSEFNNYKKENKIKIDQLDSRGSLIEPNEKK